MNDDQLLRYSRHILLDDIGIEGQRRWLAAHVLVIGAGGLGAPVALYLGSAGIGRITVVDDDVVDMTNLQRQIAHTMARVDQPKVASVAQAIGAINPEVQVIPVMARADAALLDQRVVNVPQRKLSLFSDYKLTAWPGASVNGLFSYESGKPATSDGQTVLPDAWQLDLGASLVQNWGKRSVQWRVGLENVTDRLYWREAPSTSWGGTYLFASTPRTLKTSVTVGF